MVEERYIWCRNCNEIHHATPFDRAPAFRFENSQPVELPMDDWRAFVRRHFGHRLEGLRGVGERYAPSGQPMDPMKVGYAEVTNGKESFVLRSFRRHIDEPLQFEIVPGRLRPSGATVTIRRNDIRREMKHYLSGRPEKSLDDDGVELFIQLFEEVACGWDPNEFARPGEDAGSTADVALSDAVVGRLIERCRGHFGPEALSGLKRFVETHRNEDGVMALRIVRQYKIHPSLG